MNDPVLTVQFDDEGVLRCALIGSISADRIPELKRNIAEAKLTVYGEYQKRAAKFKSLIDLTDFDGTYVPEALSVIAEFMKSNKSYVERSAVFGGSSAINVGANVLVTLAGRDNVSFFGTEAQARAWLSSDEKAVLPPPQ